MDKGRKKACFALLCAMVLLFPAWGVPDAQMYDCDNCGAYGPALENASAPGYREDGEYGQWVEYCCSGCGLPLAQIPVTWRRLDPPPVLTAEPTSTPAPTAEPASTPAPTAEPTPTPVPTAEPTSTPTLTVVPQPAITPEPAAVIPDHSETPVPPLPDETVIPVIPDVSPVPETAPTETPPPAPDSGTGAGGPSAAPEPGRTGSGTPAVRRDLVKYPYFSEAYPARRLNLPGDPEAEAPVPGE